MEGLNLQDALLPYDPYYAWDIFLYVILALQLITLAFVFTGPLRDVLVMAIVLICGVADKTYIFGFLEGNMSTFASAAQFHAERAFLTYVTRVAMFALPMILVTQTKIQRAKPIAVVLAVLSLVYTFGRWFFQQRTAAQQEQNLLSPENQWLVAHVGILALMWLQVRIGNKIRPKPTA